MYYKMSNSKKMLDQFLQSNKYNKNKPELYHTHTLIPNPPYNFGGCYVFNTNKKYNQFLDLYYNSVFLDRTPGYFTEGHIDYSPILIDLDFRHDTSIIRRQYDEEFIKSFLNIYIGYVKTFLEIPEDIHIETFILEKSKIKKDSVKNIVKDGIHIMIPSIVTLPKLQYILRYKMINNKNVKSLLSNLNITNSVEDVFDICVIEKNNWQMYGSTKPGCEPYRVTKIYDFTNEEIVTLPKNKYDNRELLTLLSIRNKTKNDIIEIKEDALEIIDKDYNRMPDKDKVRKAKKMVVKRKSKKINIKENKQLSHIEEIVDILDKSRASDYSHWIQLGWCLHNIDIRLLEVWDNFSKNSNKYKVGECKNEWEYMNEDEAGLGLGTLYMWAKQDNYGKYKELTSKNLYTILMKSLNCSHADIANVIYHMFKDEFVYSKKKVWYQFFNHKWNKIDECIPLKLKITSDVVDQYWKLHTSISAKAQAMEEGDPAKEIEIERLKKIMNVIMKLKNNSFKKNLIEECCELFYIDKFEDLLDTNIYLIGFENGVYDLENDIFRIGMPEDYLSFSTKIEYIDYGEFKDYEHEIEEVRAFIDKVLPIKDVREYVLNLFASFLDGGTQTEHFYIWTGSGGNGKSKIIELFQYAFGDYCCTLPSSLITQKRARAEACNPVLVNAKGKRFACLQEPEGDERINVGLMKELTGGDKITARGLHKDPIEFKPQFKLVLTCNDLPQIPSNDNGTWRRIRTVNFPSKFVEKPNPKKKYEYEIDYDIPKKLQEWGNAFMYIVLEYYKDYKKTRKISEPDSVTKHTNEYKQSSDQFSIFFNEKFTETEKDTDIIQIDEAYFHFQEWYKLAYGSTKLPSRKDLQTNMKKIYTSTDHLCNRFKRLTWTEHDDIENNGMLD